MCCNPTPSVERREISVTTSHDKCRLMCPSVPGQLSAAVQLSVHGEASVSLCETLGVSASRAASQPDAANQATAAKTSVLPTSLVRDNTPS